MGLFLTQFSNPLLSFEYLAYTKHLLSERSDKACIKHRKGTAQQGDTGMWGEHVYYLKRSKFSNEAPIENDGQELIRLIYYTNVKERSIGRSRSLGRQGKGQSRVVSFVPEEEILDLTTGIVTTRVGAMRNIMMLRYCLPVSVEIRQKHTKKGIPVVKKELWNLLCCVVRCQYVVRHLQDT